MPKAVSTLVKSTPAPAFIDLDPAATPAPDPWAKARRFVEAAQLFQRASLAAQIMAGFELTALHKEWGVQRGGDRRSKPHDAALLPTWAEAVKEHLGISPDTAARWMEMARVAKPRLSKGDLDLGRILEKNPGALTPAEQELLKKAVHQISDGRTQMEFMLECCGERKPSAPKPASPKPDSAPGKPRPVTTEDLAALDADVVWWAEQLPELHTHLSIRATWTKLAILPEASPRANLSDLRDLLAASLEAIEAHLKNHSA